MDRSPWFRALVILGVTAIGLYIAFYYGLTGFACAWYYRRTLRDSPRNLWMRLRKT